MQEQGGRVRLRTLSGSIPAAEGVSMALVALAIQAGGHLEITKESMELALSLSGGLEVRMREDGSVGIEIVGIDGVGV